MLLGQEALGGTVFLTSAESDHPECHRRQPPCWHAGQGGSGGREEGGPSPWIPSLRKKVTPTPPRSGLVLFVADLLHPVNGLAVETFLNSDVRHGRGWRGPVPMFLPRRKPDHVTWPNLLNRPTPALDP